MNRERRKVECTEQELKDFLKSHADTYGQPVEFDGLRYTVLAHSPTPGAAIWKKPIAVQENEKFYLVKD